MSSNNQYRMDAADQYFLQNQLQHTDPTKYLHLVPGAVGRKLVPPVPGVSANLPTHRYTMTKLLGQAKRSSSKSKAAPTFRAVKEEKSQNIKTYDGAFGWTVDEIRAAREAGVDLPGDSQQAAVTGLEQKIDANICLGDAEAGITGLANNAEVPNTNASDKGGGNTSWLHANADPDEILADIEAAISATQDALKQAQFPGSEVPQFDQFALYIPVKHMTRLMTKRLGATNEVTLLKYLRENFEMLKAIRGWHRLDTANGGNPMAVLVPALDNGAMNPLAGGALLPLDYEQLPEQYSGRQVSVPVAAKAGGVIWRYPVAGRTIKLI